MKRFFWLCPAGLSLLLFLLIIASCDRQSKDERLARRYCSSCHQYTSPSMLDKTTWEKTVLPHMALRMGILDALLGVIPAEDMNRVLTSIPSKPMVTNEEWKLINDFFIRNAPDSLIINQPEIEEKIDGFTIERFALSNQRFTTLIKFDSSSHTTYLGTRSSHLYQLDSLLRPIDSTQLASPPSYMSITDGTLELSLMGIIDPNDQAVGQIIELTKGFGTSSVLIDSIQRPVHFERTDLNNDGIDDYIVSAFGNYTGQLDVYEGLENGMFQKHNINYSPGARKVSCMDFNNDGLMDFIALMTQGDERLILYLNNGDFNFQQKTLKQFSPLNGSSYFELADFNGDGFADILYTNGDNSDYSRILKPYHAVTIFENDGKNDFEKKWSFPMHGACEAMARDFDNDGDLDIAAISFFPDHRKHPTQSFIYFRNDGRYQFTPQITEHAADGKWLVMEAGDFDNDKDIDIMLGNASVNVSQSTEKKMTFLLLRNKKIRNAAALN
jgi:hypothetical protein